jgi:hypothetical protein
MIGNYRTITAFTHSSKDRFSPGIAVRDDRATDIGIQWISSKPITFYFDKHTLQRNASLKVFYAAIGSSEI